MVGQAVKHRIFGKGIITGMQQNIVTICFSEGEKNFVYPDAFGDFLSLRDTAEQKRIQSLLEQKQQKYILQQQAAQKDVERARKLTQFKININAQAAFHLTPAQLTELPDTWCVSTGVYLSGQAKGTPRVPSRLRPNSACLLTCKAARAPEAERKIVGLFMVKEDFFGDECNTGLIYAHDRFRILLDETQTLPFWDVLCQQEQPRWGSMAFKYISNRQLQSVLLALLQQLEDPQRKQQCQQLQQYFFEKNRLLQPILPDQQPEK